MMSLAMNLRQDPCSIDDALRALSDAVDREMLVDGKTDKVDEKVSFF